MWTSFAANLDPNGHGGEFWFSRCLDVGLTSVVSHIPKWPEYSSKMNFVFRLPRNESYVEDDTYRVEGMEAINRIVR
jgi:triacylglycerol lipase